MRVVGVTKVSIWRWRSDQNLDKYTNAVSWLGGISLLQLELALEADKDFTQKSC